MMTEFNRHICKNIEYERRDHNFAGNTEWRAGLFGDACSYQEFFDYLKGGDFVDEFLVGFSSVQKDQVIELLSMAEGTFTFTGDWFMPLS